MKSVGLVLDTSGYSAYVGGNLLVKPVFTEADLIYVPAIVIGELLYGFYKGSQMETNYTRLQAMLTNTRVSVVAIDLKTAEIYGQLKDRQRRSGRTVDDNDLWIAAVCLQLQLPLLTLDSDFARIPELDLVEL